MARCKVKLKKLILFLLSAAVLAAAQTGLMGGSEGIHQINASTLGQWNFVIGTGGNFALDPWSLTRGGVFYDDGVRDHLQHYKVSATGNFFAAVGIGDYVNTGVAFNINYDRSYANGYLEATGNIRQGDLDLWLKVRAPFIDESSALSLAMQLDLFMPIGSKSIGLRPRHAWYIRGRGETQPYSADEVVPVATAIASVDFKKILDIPIRWNTSIGFAYANAGANTLLYSTGFDWDWADWITAFVEYSGEFRVENNGMPISFLNDPMLVTPGLRLHLPYNLELAGGIDLSTRMMRVGYDLDKEMKDVDKFTVGYTDTKGYHKTYGYTPTVTYAITGVLTWTFGGGKKAPEPACPLMPEQEPAPDTSAVVVRDTVVQVDTVTNTVVIADTIRDADSDGVVDSLDQCPNTPAGFPVDAQGCPLDEDHDGVSDSLDKCPGTPEGVQVGMDGCARDFDQDGVPDFKDMCPNTAAGVGVDSTGCAMDEDKDGVPDTRDQCPLTPKGAPVDTTGCPIDTDRDGVPDYLDKCPNNLRGIKVNKQGCPVNKKEDLETLKKGINFKTGSTVLTKASYKTLNDIVNLMTKLADVSLEIQGHTDNVGDSTYNEELSHGRAQSAVSYIISKGIEAKRLRAAGYGSRKPIADNKTKKGRAKNRRVELVPFYPDDEENNQ